MPPGFCAVPIVEKSIELTPSVSKLGDREEFIAGGMDDCIAKPISRERLRDVLRGIRHQPDKQLGQPPASAPNDLAGARTTPVEESHEVEGLPGPLIDHALLEEQTGGDNALLRTLVSVFEEDQPELLRTLDVALSNGETDGAAIAAHTLKGALGVLGAEPVRQLAGAMEQAARDGQLGDCRVGHPLLRDSVLRVTQELRALPHDD